MRTIDFSPLYRSVVGFDRLADLLDAASADAGQGYPPYNIERTGENDYRIEIAVAGFKPEELTIDVKEAVLTVQGRKAANDEPRRYLHRGLAERNFERRFQLAEYVAVTDAHLADGLLTGTLIECAKHHGRFDITDGSPQRQPACVALKTYKAAERDGKIFLDLETA